MSAVLKTVPIQFRAMSYADLATVMAIERRAYPFPWTDTIFRDCIRVGYRCRVLEIHSRLESYAVMSIGANEAHLLNICVRPESQRCGLARRMLEHLLELAGANVVKTMFLEVRPSNERAIRLYHAMGFCEIGLRKGYYPAARGREDAVVMAKEL
ncbi:MAG TPA: ribosomal protein S18-alanine N-acetyltransferase [Candidatus Competibacteraceae bacterium]|nr:ribosomal protein S18-alanine N-acetyltransferase [Candidatus Competibacteraceae bacterium]